jgi:hypothetical protein
MKEIQLVFDINKDGMIDYDDIYEFIIRIMNEQKKNKLLSGDDKKLNTLNQIRAVIGGENYDRYEPFLKKTIDFIYKNFIKNKCYKKIFCC